VLKLAQLGSVTMAYKYNKEEEGNCKHCGKSLKEADNTCGYRDGLHGNTYGYKLYCSYRCINDAYIKRRKERNLQARSNLVCEYCKKVFNGTRKDTKFCSGKCRVADFRIMKKIEIREKKEHDAEIKRIWEDNRKNNPKYMKSACDTLY